jgi:hypothetical protein
MSHAFSLIVFPVKDMAKAKTVYGKLLGAEPYMENPYYAGFRVDGQDIGLDPNGHKKGMTGPLGYCEVADIRKRHNLHSIDARSWRGSAGWKCTSSKPVAGSPRSRER